MDGTLISKIENNGILKIYRMSKIGLPITMLPLLLDLYFGIEKTSIDLISFWLIVFMNILSIWSFIDSKMKISKNKQMPFIEWWTDKIVFRSSKTGQESSILIDDISDVSIKFDAISISTISNKSFEINLDEYMEYDQRIKIKDNFAALSKEINHHVIAERSNLYLGRSLCK